jgi:hypothetical protein
MENTAPPPLFPPINLSPQGPLTEEDKELMENWNRILAGPVNTTNFLWKEKEEEGDEEGKEEEEEEEEEVESFEESEETEGSEELEDSDDEFGGDYAKIYNVSSSSSGST